MLSLRCSSERHELDDAFDKSSKFTENSSHGFKVQFQSIPLIQYRFPFAITKCIGKRGRQLEEEEECFPCLQNCQIERTCDMQIEFVDVTCGSGTDVVEYHCFRAMTFSPKAAREILDHLHVSQSLFQSWFGRRVLTSAKEYDDGVAYKHKNVKSRDALPQNEPKFSRFYTKPQEKKRK